MQFFVYFQLCIQVKPTCKNGSYLMYYMYANLTQGAMKPTVAGFPANIFKSRPPRPLHKSNREQKSDA